MWRWNVIGGLINDKDRNEIRKMLEMHN